MERHLIKILLFTSVIQNILSVPRKYYLIQQVKTWNDALIYCQANHESLAIINSDGNLMHLQSEIQMHQFTSTAWIGMYNDFNSWHWSLGNVLVGSTTLWASIYGQPSNYAYETCGGLLLQGLTDEPCNLLLPFVCFDGQYSGTDSYIYNPIKMTWNDAQSYCRQHHTDLTSVRDQTERSIIDGKSGGYYIWIGMFRNSWKWTDGTTFSTIPWMPGQPDYTTAAENCIAQNNGQVSDAQCSNALPFFCYSIITGKKQYLRMKLMSSQDLNDSAVQATILGKIAQKLMDHGLAENTSLKLREQTDGLLFYKEK